MFRSWIFTRFNKLDAQLSIYNNPAIPDPEAWMKHRIKLFNEITLPSVMLQSCMDFTWLLSFDKQTPKHITDYYATWPNVKIIYEYPADYLRGLFGTVLNKGDWICTHRIDNDDYISPTFIEKVQAQFNNKFLLVDTDGRLHELATGKLYTVERKSNNSPFISLIEQVGTPWMSISKDPKERRLITNAIKTVYWCSHSKMEWHFPSVKINEVLYRTTVHDENVSNKIHDHCHEVGTI